MAVLLNRVGVVSVAWLFCWALPANATQKPLTFQNMAGETITAITITNKQSPDRLVMPPLAASLAVSDTVDVSVEVTEDACLHDITYFYSSGKTVLQENVDLCSTDALIIE